MIFYRYLFILFLLAFTTCSEQVHHTKPGIVGKMSEVLVVAEADVWEGAVGDSLRYVLSEPYPMLPQYEPQFDVRHIEPERFNNYEKRAGTVIVMSIGEKEQNREARMTKARDTYANGQRIFTIYALSDTAFFRILNQFKTHLLDELNFISSKRGADHVKFTKVPYYSELVNDRFGFEIVIPKGFNVTVDEENVLCFQRRRERTLKLPQLGARSHDIIDQIAIYRYEHNSDSTFTLERQIQIRDSILGKYIQSTSDYPIITERKLYPLIEEVNYQDNYGVEMRGLWKFQRPLMGGPFVSVNFFNAEKKYAVGVEGNVFAPKFDKRDYVRELESIIYSSTFAADSVKTQ